MTPFDLLWVAWGRFVDLINSTLPDSTWAMVNQRSRIYSINPPPSI